MGRRGRKKKFEEGTADAFRMKKRLNKLTIEDATAFMKELDDVYEEYKKEYDEASTKSQKTAIEIRYLDKVDSDIKRAKYVGNHYEDLIPGLMGVISDVFYNMKYTQLYDKRDIMAARKACAMKKLEKMKAAQTKEEKPKKKRTRKPKADK